MSYFWWLDSNRIKFTAFKWFYLRKNQGSLFFSRNNMHFYREASVWQVKFKTRASRVCSLPILFSPWLQQSPCTWCIHPMSWLAVQSLFFKTSELYSASPSAKLNWITGRSLSLLVTPTIHVRMCIAVGNDLWVCFPQQNFYGPLEWRINHEHP